MQRGRNYESTSNSIQILSTSEYDHYDPSQSLPPVLRSISFDGSVPTLDRFKTEEPLAYDDFEQPTQMQRTTDSEYVPDVIMDEQYGERYGEFNHSVPDQIMQSVYSMAFTETNVLDQPRSDSMYSALQTPVITAPTPPMPLLKSKIETDTKKPRQEHPALDASVQNHPTLELPVQNNLTLEEPVQASSTKLQPTNFNENRSKILPARNDNDDMYGTLRSNMSLSPLRAVSMARSDYVSDYSPSDRHRSKRSMMSRTTNMVSIYDVMADEMTDVAGGVTKEEIREEIRFFLHDTGLNSVTKREVKEHLYTQFGEAVDFYLDYIDVCIEEFTLEKLALL
jgi:hypothetical protein